MSGGLGDLHAQTCGRGLHQLTMVVVDGGDIFLEQGAVELVVAYGERNKQGAGSLKGSKRG